MEVYLNEKAQGLQKILFIDLFTNVISFGF